MLSELNLSDKEVVFLDLDGTIVGENGIVSPTFWDALERAKKRNMIFVVCTGRTCAGVAQDIGKRFEENTGLHYAHIFDSGALGVQPGDRKLAFAFTMEKETLRILVDHSRRINVPLELYTSEGVFADERSPDGEEHSKMLRMPFLRADLMQIIEDKKVIRCHWIARAHNFEEALSIEIPGLHVARAGSPALPQMRFASITKAGVSKGDAIAKWCDIYGVDAQKCYGVGDTIGDLSMLEAVGFPYVMANGDEALKARFPNLPSIQKDGVCTLLSSIESKLNTLEL